MLERYRSFIAPKATSSQMWGVNEDTMSRGVHKVYQRRRRDPWTIWIEKEPFGADLLTFHFWHI